MIFLSEEFTFFLTESSKEIVAQALPNTFGLVFSCLKLAQPCYGL